VCERERRWGARPRGVRACRSDRGGDNDREGADAPDPWSAGWTHLTGAALSRCQRHGAHLAMATAANASASAAETSSNPDGDCRRLATHDAGRHYKRCDAPGLDGGSEGRLRTPHAHWLSKKTAAACGRAEECSVCGCATAPTSYRRHQQSASEVDHDALV